MFIFVVAYWTISIKSPLNIGVRHIIPTLPFIYILTTGVIKKFVSEGKTIIKLPILLILIFAYFINTLINAPHYLSFFNLLGRGENGYQYVTDSNFDWGQDLKRLNKFIEKNNISRIGVDYFGGGDPKYYLGDKAEYWWSEKGDPRNYGIKYLALSVNTLQGAKGKLAKGETRKPEDEYSWLKNPYKPYARAGKSIFIYKL
jgi:hypothetical protein